MLLINELNHRVKNTLATIQAMALQSFPRDKPETKDFMSRLTSLSGAHDILTSHNWGGAEIHQVVEGALSPFGPTRFTLEGAGLRLSPKHTLALSMALHELATNAVKYGSARAQSGRVAIAWRLTENGTRVLSTLTWREAGGPPAARPSKQGFGSKLLLKALASDFGSAAEMDFAPDGVRVTIRITLTDED